MICVQCRMKINGPNYRVMHGDPAGFNITLTYCVMHTPFMSQNENGGIKPVAYYLDKIIKMIEKEKIKRRKKN